MSDHFTDEWFGISNGDGGYLNVELMNDGSLEIALCDGQQREDYRDGRMETRQDEITIPPERVPDVLVGIQAWIEQLQ